MRWAQAYNIGVVNPGGGMNRGGVNYPELLRWGCMGRKRCTARVEALRVGATRYSTGKPCRRGHIAMRRTSKGTCVACEALLWTGFPETAKGAAQRMHARLQARRRKISADRLSVAELLALILSAEARGIAFTYASDDPASPSLDRIDSARPYERGNVRVVPLWYNYAKHDWTDERLRRAMALAPALLL